MDQTANSSRKAHVALKSTDKLKLLDDLRRRVNQTAAPKKYGIERSTVFVLHVLTQEQREIEEINIPEANPPEEFTAQEFNEFVDIDSGEQCSVVMTNEDICAEISGQVLLADDGEKEPKNEVDAEKATPTRQVALKMLHSLRHLCSIFEDKDQVLEKLTTLNFRWSAANAQNRRS